MAQFDLDSQTFAMTVGVGFQDLTVIRDALQLAVSDAKTSPEPNITERLNAIQSAAEALGIHENIDWSTE